jgi:hypothetical protein
VYAGAKAVQVFAARVADNVLSHFFAHDLFRNSAPSARWRFQAFFAASAFDEGLRQRAEENKKACCSWRMFGFFLGQNSRGIVLAGVLRELCHRAKKSGFFAAFCASREGGSLAVAESRARSVERCRKLVSRRKRSRGSPSLRRFTRVTAKCMSTRRCHARVMHVMFGRPNSRRPGDAVGGFSAKRTSNWSSRWCAVGGTEGGSLTIAGNVHKFAMSSASAECCRE